MSKNRSRKKNGLSLLNRIKGKRKKAIDGFKKKYMPTEYINGEVAILDQNLEAYMDLQRQFCQYYHQKRIERKEHIEAVIEEHMSKQFGGDSLWRIVSTDFSQDPLCTIGSVLRPPGGRLNFGEGLEGYEQFHSLYIADSSQTATFEKFHDPETYSGDEYSQDFLSLGISESHTSFRLKAEFSSIIDLRDDDFLKDFLECIKDIPDPVDLNKIAKFHGWRRSTSVKTLEGLKDSLLDHNYTHYGITYGLPSNSQWLGYLCYKMGVQAVIFPSVRNKEGFNIAVFPDNFINDAEAHVSLADEIKYISQSRKSINKSNYKDFKEAESI